MKTLTTANHAFPGVAGGFKTLFAAQAGVPSDQALEHVSTLLDTALRNSMDTAMESQGSNPWNTVYLLEMSLALVNAIIVGMDQEDEQ